MQNPLTLFSSLDLVQYDKDFENSHKGGFFDLRDWGVIEILGPDAADYLQRMSTANIKALETGGYTDVAFLTGKGTVVLVGNLFRPEPNRFLFIVSPGQIERALEHIEQFHFQEKLKIENKSLEYAILGLWKASSDLKKSGWQDAKRNELFFVLIPRTQLETTCKIYLEKGLSVLGMPLFHFFRIESGVPWVGWEAGEADLVLEAGLEYVVARNKGCYPGQEVVERIFTYGQVNRKLLRVELECEQHAKMLAEGVEWRQGEALVGELVSQVPVPCQPSKCIGLAYIRKGFWENKEVFKIQEGVTIRNA